MALEGICLEGNWRRAFGRGHLSWRASGTTPVNWEENRELGVVRLHIFNSRISNSRKIPGPKKRELGGHTVVKYILKSNGKW